MRAEQAKSPAPIPRSSLLALTLLAFSLPLHASDWQLLYQDDFNRADVGPAWTILGDPGVALAIDNGELVGDGRGAILFNHPVRGDQKIIFEGRWIEGTGKSITQFAGLLKGSTFYGQHTGVGLIHGRTGNTTNTVEFLSPSGRLARNTGPLPEPGKKYTFEAAVEGDHTWLKRDGELIIEAKLPFKLEGPGFDRILLYAMEKRVRFDSVKIYRKGTDPLPVPATYPLPTRVSIAGVEYAGADSAGAVAAAIAMQRKGDAGEALAAASAIEDPKLRLDALMMLALDTQYQPYRDLCLAVARLLKENPTLEPPQAPGSLTLGRIAAMMAVIAHPSHNQAPGYAVYLKPRLDESHPFYPALLFFHGRRILLSEGGISEASNKAEGERHLQELYLRDPANQLYRMLLGERVPWGAQYQTVDPNAPHWARIIREMHGRLLDVVNWWVDVKQAPDGQLGGGWGDDVETLRAWGPILIISDANASARAGMKKIVDGAWEKAEGGLHLGYSKRKWDVEHSAEPSADTQPLMLMFEPGNPLYVDRNRLLLPLTRDLWTARTPQGHLVFKTVQMSATQIDDAPEFQASTPYHTRAMKGLSWLVWAGDTGEVKQTWLALADAWVDATLREESGKLPGVVPVAINYQTGRIGSARGNWYRPRLGWVYYDWSQLNHQHIYGLLAAAYLATGDDKYIAPIAAAVEQATQYQPRQGYTPPAPQGDELPTAEYQRYTLNQWYRQGFFVPYLLAPRTRTGSNRFDHALQTIAAIDTIDPVAHYQITGDASRLVAEMDRKLEETIRYNFPMVTSQLLRIDHLKTMYGIDELYCLMTGALKHWGDSFWPTQAVTFRHPNLDFAALTRRTAPNKVTIRFYNFDTTSDAFSLDLWRLPAGNYTLRVTTDDGAVFSEQSITLQGICDKIDLKLPANRALRIDITP